MEKILDSFRCPITQELMVDPVMDLDGNSYERAAIELWLTKEQCSPMTRRPLKVDDLRPNRSLQDSINVFRSAGLAPVLPTEILMKNNTNTNERNVMPVITLETSVEFSSIASNGERQDFLIMGTIKGKVTDLNLNRAPTDIVCVIDRSGSMDGTKIELCRHTLTFVVSQLKETDSLGIVVFDNTVDTILRPTKMNESGKLQAEDAISHITTRGSTNLCGGLLHGLSLLEEGNAKISSLMLLTDGRANHGIIETSKIVEALKQRKIQCSSIHTFGIGDHDAGMLKAISDTANGIYYFLQDQDKIPESVGDCLGGLLSVVGTNVTMTIEGSNGLCTITEVITKFPKTPLEGNQSTVTIGDIQCGEEKNILCRVSIPRISEVGRFEIGKIRVSYAETIGLANGSDGVPQQLQVNTEQGVWLERTDDGSESKEVNFLLDQQRNRMNAVNGISKASSLANENKLDEARELITKIMEEISMSVSHEDVYCQSLLDDLRECLRGMRDRKSYSSFGSSDMQSKSSSHSFQRSNTATKSYTTVHKKKAQFDSADWSMKKMVEKKEVKTDSTNDTTAETVPYALPLRLSGRPTAMNTKKKAPIRVQSGVWASSSSGLTRVPSVKGLSPSTTDAKDKIEGIECDQAVALNESQSAIPNTITNEVISNNSSNEAKSQAIVPSPTNTVSNASEAIAETGRQPIESTSAIPVHSSIPVSESVPVNVTLENASESCPSFVSESIGACSISFSPSACGELEKKYEVKEDNFNKK